MTDKMEMPDGCLNKDHKSFVSKNEANVEAKSLFSTDERQIEGGKITGLFAIEEFLALRKENEQLEAKLDRANNALDVAEWALLLVNNVRTVQYADQKHIKDALETIKFAKTNAPEQD